MIREVKLQSYPATITISVNDSDDFFQAYKSADDRWHALPQVIATMDEDEDHGGSALFSSDGYNYLIRITWDKASISPKKAGKVTNLSLFAASTILMPTGMQMSMNTMMVYANLASYITEEIWAIVRDMNKKP